MHTLDRCQRNTVGVDRADAFRCLEPDSVGRVTNRVSIFEPGVSMDKNRIEAFSDGVIAVIITIIVLEMKFPHGPEFASLVPLLPR
jgi:hypothetical protein